MEGSHARGYRVLAEASNLLGYKETNGTGDVINQQGLTCIFLTVTNL